MTTPQIIDLLKRVRVSANGMDASTYEEIGDAIFTLERRLWQPIETAPKDGSLILACSNRGRYAPKTIVWATYHPNATGKACWRDSEICGNKMEGVTHWMPLPAKPQ